MRKVFLLLCFLLLQGCYMKMTNLAPEEKRTIQERIYDVKYESLFKPVMETFEDMQYTIDSADKGEGIITTDWKKDHFTNRKVTARIEKLSESKTVIRLNLSKQFKFADKISTMTMSVLEAKKLYNKIFSNIETKLK